MKKSKEIHLYLIRGLIREKEHWGEFPKMLLAALPEATLHYLEIPGTGEFYDEESPNNFQDMVDSCRMRHKINIKDLDRINIAITISLGGMVMSEWLKLYPQDFEGVVLMNSSFKGLSPILKRVKPQAILEFLKIAVESDTRKREQKIVRLVINSKSKRNEATEKWERITKLRPVNKKNSLRQLWAGATFSPMLEKPEYTKVLILAGLKDRLCDYSCSSEIFKRWGGTIRFHPESGHDLPTDAGPWVAQHIEQFVSNNLV